jgi:hypothetical protein
MPVPTKSGGNEITTFKSSANSNRRGFLSLTLMDGPGHDAFEKKRFHPVFELPNQNHPPVKAKQKNARIGSRLLVAAIFVRSDTALLKGLSVFKDSERITSAGFLTGLDDLLQEHPGVQRFNLHGGFICFDVEDSLTALDRFTHCDQPTNDFNR